MVIWGDIKEILRVTLTFLNKTVGDPGLAIILLTTFVQFLLLPLTIKQTKSMQEMQRLQPKLKKLQEKYKNNKEKLQKEIMKFYSEHKVNPFGGCMPLILQMPVFIALFRVLWEATPKEIKVLTASVRQGKGPSQTELESIKALGKVIGRSSVLGVSNLSKAASDLLSFRPLHLKGSVVEAIPYFILIVLMAVTTYVSSKQMSSDPQQDRLMLFMGLFFVFIAWSFPAGVIIYWVTTNILTIIRQHFTLRFAGEAGLATSPEKPIPKKD